jgi:hypothetical protein
LHADTFATQLVLQLGLNCEIRQALGRLQRERTAQSLSSAAAAEDSKRENDAKGGEKKCGHLHVT